MCGWVVRLWIVGVRECCLNRFGDGVVCWCGIFGFVNDAASVVKVSMSAMNMECDG